ncbi:MAG: ribonuclease R family protein, partial [Elusimicrobiota bacterium]
ERGTSVYLPGKVVPMLPEKISNDLCSLVPGKDRLAVSVFMNIDGHGTVKDYRFSRSVIRSKKRYTYEEVDKILENNSPGNKSLNRDIVLMVELAKKLGRKRSKRGSIDFEFPELRLVLDSKNKVKEVLREERTMSHRLIEEFMILCNEVVASHMSTNKIPSIYRVHERPDRKKVKAFRDFIQLFGFNLPAYKKLTPKHLQNILSKIKQSKEEVVISTMMLRSLQQAVYSDVNRGHFALACKHYTHFTSPIRRYPDLLVHRLLVDIIEKGRVSPDRKKLYKKNMNKWSQKLSTLERNASSAEMEVNELKIMEYMKDKTGRIYEGIISGITSFGIFVELDMGLEGLIHIRNLKDDYYEFCENRMMLKGKRKKREFKIGQDLKVKLIRVDLSERQVDFLPA